MKIAKVAIPVTGFKYNLITRIFSHSQYDLINHRDVIIKEFGIPQLIQQMGLRAFNELLNSVCFYISLECPDEIADNLPLVSITGFDRIDLFVFCLWFIKDNSVNVQECYSHVVETGAYNFLTANSIYSTCTGEHIEENFTNEELERAEIILLKVISLINDKAFKRETYEQQIQKKEGRGVHTGILNKVNYNNKNRIERAFGFLRAVRKTDFIIMKVSLYMNIYECLFGTDASEIIHKLAERTACYYTKDKQERIEVFKFIKKAYGVRSRYFHGKELDKANTFNKIPEMLIKLDSITRTILTKVIMEDSEIFLQSDMEDYFTSLIFG